MNPMAVLAHARELWDAHDQARPVTMGCHLRRAGLPPAVPGPLGLVGGDGVGCVSSSPNDDPPDEICDNGVDDDGNGAVHCDDLACEAVEPCYTGPPERAPARELCEDGIDHNGNGDVVESGG